MRIVEKAIYLIYNISLSIESEFCLIIKMIPLWRMSFFRRETLLQCMTFFWWIMFLRFLRLWRLLRINWCNIINERNIGWNNNSYWMTVRYSIIEVKIMIFIFNIWMILFWVLSRYSRISLNWWKKSWVEFCE